jgi:hypothetical protein
MSADGQNPSRIYSGAKPPLFWAWSNQGPVFAVEGDIRTATATLFSGKDRPIWPQFDVLPGGRFVVAPVEIRETALWAIDLVYVPN